ncbi:redoxin family protein [Microbulbifer sp. MLAF003]|uniref:peroxiredoxin family protein n=1 Tax=Microbulbifer TaxID=48073 RepID=UPI00037D6C30|nr:MULTISPECIES: redoxin domain-containing protein [Microbulbifer]WHI53376.1 redoxin family protein [Microbulbifer sp. MLAF003]
MKTKLILPMILSNMLSGIAAGIMIYVSGGNPIWIGALLATLPLPFFLMVITNVFSISRTSERLPVIQVINFAGIALVAYTLYFNQAPLSLLQYVSVAITALGFVSLHWYIWSFSYYNRGKSKAISKGQKLPEMHFNRLDGTDVSSSSFGGTKTLLVFFRANWCPFCMNQLKEVKKYAEKLKQYDVSVKFISNQGFDNSQNLARKLDLPNHFEILQDEDLKGAKILGIEDIDGSPVGMPGYPKDTVMATVIALDEEGKVLFGDETDNYRRRPNPTTFLHVFESSKPQTLKATPTLKSTA